VTAFVTSPSPGGACDKPRWVRSRRWEPAEPERRSADSRTSKALIANVLDCQGLVAPPVLGVRGWSRMPANPHSIAHYTSAGDFSNSLGARVRVRRGRVRVLNTGGAVGKQSRRNATFGVRDDWICENCRARTTSGARDLSVDRRLHSRASGGSLPRGADPRGYR
jgi:hypothetical protein